MREMEQGVKTATLKEERLKCTDSESDEGIFWNDAWQEQGHVLKIEYGHYRKACCLILKKVDTFRNTKSLHYGFKKK